MPCFFLYCFCPWWFLMVGGILADQETHQAIAQSGPVVLGEKAPDFAVVTEGTEVALAWTEIHGAEGYRLLFSFSDGDVEDNSYEIDTGLGTELVLDFGDENILETFSHIESFENIETGLSFHVSVVAYDDEGDSRQSNVEYILCGYGRPCARKRRAAFKHFRACGKEFLYLICGARSKLCFRDRYFCAGGWDERLYCHRRFYGHKRFYVHLQRSIDS